MDLKFIWIKEHRAIKDLNFNFCHNGRHQFHYNGNKIEIYENKKSPIFFTEKITGLTAIAGKNGSGKSSFCEAVLYATATLQENSFGIDALFHGIVCFDSSLYVHEELLIENEVELSSNGYRIIRFKDSPLENEMDQRFDGEYLGHLGFVYYANTFDFKSYVEGNNLSNISTSYRLYNDKFYSSYVLNSEFKTYGKNIDDCHHQMNIFISSEHLRILKFILEFPQFVNFINDNLVIRLYSSYSGNNKFINYKYEDAETKKYLQELESRILGEVYDFLPHESKYVNVDVLKFKDLYHKLYKINLLAIIHDSIDLDIEIIRQFVYLGEINFKDNFDEFKLLIKTHESLLNEAEFDEQFHVDEHIRFISDKKDWRFYPINYFHIHLTKTTIPLLKTLIRLEEKLLNETASSNKRITNFSLFSFFSTGELSYLSMFSRIFDVIKGYQDGIYSKEELVLFLDEPDGGYHPNWSKQFLNNLVKFLNAPFNPFKIQLIITTHSPYILSDLPKENIRLFNRENHDPPKMAESKSNTFGANIYDLMHDSFFMSDGFIGTFAQEKIDDVFSELTNKLNDSKYKMLLTQDSIKSIIDIIGEPLIQRQLSALYDRVFQEDLETEIITRQIDALQRLRDRKTNKSKK